jgi:hypothetical protein
MTVFTFLRSLTTASVPDLNYQGMPCTFVLNISQPLLSSFYKHGMCIFFNETGGV